MSVGRRREIDAARRAGLRYRGDEGPGIARSRRQGRFAYRDARGRTIRDAATLQRIRTLAIPPAWTEVWIAPRANQHLQATGHDARGRKQYRYHAKWITQRDSAKYGGLLRFADSLPRIRRRVAHDLRRPGLPREKVLACVVELLDAAHLRIGNDQYARENQSFGLTTLLDRHATIRGNAVRLRFRGKSGVQHDLKLRSKRLARIIERCQALDGRQLFQYVDRQGRVRDVTSTDVNRYIQKATGAVVTAKEFRTWAGTVLAAAQLRACPECDAAAEAKRHVRMMFIQVAEQLGNTVAVCRKSYIHPAIVDAYLSRTLHRAVNRAPKRKRAPGLSQDELALLSVLRTWASGRQPLGHARRRKRKQTERP